MYMEEIKSKLEKEFVNAWAKMQGISASSLDDAKLLQKWWDSLKNLNPDLLPLVHAMETLQKNPFVAILTVYAYGMAHGIEAMMDEEIMPVAFGSENERTPQWLQDMINEDLAKRFAGRLGE